MTETPSFIKTKLLKILSDSKSSELESIEEWISSKVYKDDLKQMKSLSKSSNILDQVRKTIREICPLEAEFPSEIITAPLVGDQADCNKVNTCHIDEFLYDEVDVQKLEDEGKIHRRYCVDCGSRNVKDLTFISHSMSKLALQYVFKVLLPNDLDEKNIVDVGSRLGAVIFGAYFLSNASKIVGIEINETWCDIKRKIIEQYNMDNKRIKAICADVMQCSDVLKDSNIVIINVLDFFVNVETHRQLWHFFKKSLTKGTYVLSCRSILETLGYLDLQEEFEGWLQICRPFQLENEKLFDFDDYNYSDLCLYVVK